MEETNSVANETVASGKNNKTIIFIICAVLLIAIAIGFFRINGNAIVDQGNVNVVANTNNEMSIKNTQVLFKTSEGDIVMELYADKAPITVKNFLNYVDDGSYDGTVFHRVIDGFMIQGGGFDKNGKQRDTRDAIELESDNGLKNEEGTVAMARTSDPDSATNQFFINTADNIFLDYGYRDEGYAVFAKVIKGMDVVKKIEGVQITTKHGMGDWPVNDAVIISVKRV